MDGIKDTTLGVLYICVPKCGPFPCLYDKLQGIKGIHIQRFLLKTVKTGSFVSESNFPYLSRRTKIRRFLSRKFSLKQIFPNKGLSISTLKRIAARSHFDIVLVNVDAISVTAYGKLIIALFPSAIVFAVSATNSTDEIRLALKTGFHDFVPALGGQPAALAWLSIKVAYNQKLQRVH